MQLEQGDPTFPNTLSRVHGYTMGWYKPALLTAFASPTAQRVACKPWLGAFQPSEAILPPKINRRGADLLLLGPWARLSDPEY